MSTDPYVNHFSGNPLNRLAWLRTSQPFLNAIVHAPATRWLVFRDGQPLVQASGEARANPSLARLTTRDVRPLLGPEPFFSQGQREGEFASPGVKGLEAARLRGTPIVFLGLHENETTFAAALPSSDFSAKTDLQTIISNIQGSAYFSLDVSDVNATELDNVLESSVAAIEGSKLTFSEPRAVTSTLDAFEAAILAEARSMIDWNARNKFCASCGSPVYSSWAGWKLTCTSLLPWADNAGKKPCGTATGLHNFSHPRTDAVVIMAVINQTGDKILLGRNKKWPPKFWSCMSGFIEPGESFEDAVQREMWEEAGVKVTAVRYHSSQPWPYPSTIMVGMYATANSDEPLRTDLDNELDDARWFTREELLAVLSHTDGTNLSRQDYKQLSAAADGSNPNAKPDEANAQPNAAVGTRSTGAASSSGPAFKIPPRSAIGGVIISEWAVGRAGPQPVSPQTASL